MKRFLAVCLALVMALSLCACGEKLTPEEVMEEVSENMEDLESTGFSMDMKMKMDLQGMELAMKISMDGEMILGDTQVVHAKGTMEIPIMGGVDTEIYAVDDGEENITYTGVTMEDETQWTQKIEPSTKDLAESMNPAELLKLIKNLEEAEDTEEIHGVEATRYDGYVKSKDIGKLAEAMGGMDSMMGETADMDEMLETMGDAKIPVTYYVDQEEMMLVQVEIDLSDLMEEMTKASAEDSGMGEVTMKQFSMKMGFSDYDEIDEIEIPQEALDAPVEGEGIMEDSMGDE